MAADLVIRNAVIHTLDDASPSAQALAVTGGVITAAGDEDAVLAHAGADTEVRDLAGACVIPGLADIHNHHALAGRGELYELKFPPTATVPEILEAVRAHAATLPPDAWLFGGSWGSGLMGELATHAARRALDEAAGGRPVLLTDDSYHNRWVSSRTLELAGVTADTPDPAGGIILREDGAPTGIMLEGAGRAMELAVPASARPDAAGWRDCSRRGVAVLNEFGITAFQDASVSTNIMAALKSLDEAGELNAWAVTSLLVNDLIFGFAPIGADLLPLAKGYVTAHHRPTFVKIFLDGVPPARTGAFLEPYLPDEHGDHFCGETTMTQAELTDALRMAARSELSAKIHCTGDRSVQMVLDAVEQLRGEGFTAQRFQVAHGQFIADADIPRFAALGVDADISPYLWMPGVIPDAIATVLPADRAGRIQPNKDLLAAGALVAGGSDWPVSPSPNPFPAMAALISRQDPSGQFPGALWPEQAVSRADALRIFTHNGAISMGLGDVTGTLSVGKSADFAVLDRDIAAVAVPEIASVSVTETYFAGRLVHRAD